MVLDHYLNNKLRNSGGRIYLAAYIGHDKGYEISKVFDYLNKLNRKDFNVLNIKLINKDNNPPQLFIIEKTGTK